MLQVLGLVTAGRHGLLTQTVQPLVDRERNPGLASA